jgi:nucleoside-diphosphate-sugar epimerase/predicted dehydrogenase
MKIGIIGCGLNSDYHINFALGYEGAEIVGIADKDEEKARQCAERHSIKGVYTSIQELVKSKRPDVIHVVTPPQTHYSLAKEAIQCKCHVLVEKPMTLNIQEARELFALAEDCGVKLCAMHNHFFDPCMAKANALIREGKVGDIINVESYYGLNTNIDAFRKYPAPNVLPWIYSLPGGVFHDFMAHPLYVMLPYTGKPLEIKVMEKSFGELLQNISDELRILVKGDRSFGMLTFSFAAKPYLHFVKIYGTKMMIQVNIDTMTTTIHPVSHLPKAAQKATFNLSEGWQLFTNTVSNVWNFGRGKLRPYQGMKVLIHKFYDAINGKGEIPVSKEDALKVIETMDQIWPQIKNKYLSGFDPIIPVKKIQAQEGQPKILVTGATGFLGSRLIEVLSERGYQVRALARKLSDIAKLKGLNVEIFFGDVANMDSLKPVFEGVDMVVHAAADTSGREDESELSTIQGTKNVVDLCRHSKVKKLIYISSCSVYGVADYKKGQIVTEESALERFPEKRGYYSDAKLKAEEIITSAMAEGDLPIACLRPGTIFGPGGEIFTPMMGFALGSRLFGIIGNGKFVLPLVYIDNLVDAIIATVEKQESTGKKFNVVDSDNMTKKMYVEVLLKKIYSKSRYIYVPFWLLYLTVFAQEIALKMLKRKPFLTRYRLISSQRNILYDSSKIKNELNWKPPYTMRDAVKSVIDHERMGIDLSL